MWGRTLTALIYLSLYFFLHCDWKNISGGTLRGVGKLPMETSPMALCVFFLHLSITHPLPPALTTTNSLWPRYDLRFSRVNSGAGFSLFFPEQEEWTLWLLLRWTHRHVCQAIDCEKQFKSHTRALGAERNMNVRKWGDTREFNNCNISLGQWSRTGLYCRSIIQNDFQNS